MLVLKTSHDRFDGRRGCTFEVVTLTEDVATSITTHGPQVISFPNRRRSPTWPSPSSWRETPVAPGKDDAFDDCRGRVPSDVADLLNQVLESPGSWVVRDWHRVAILSGKMKVAAIFRYGD